MGGVDHDEEGVCTRIDDEIGDQKSTSLGQDVLNAGADVRGDKEQLIEATPPSLPKRG